MSKFIEGKRYRFIDVEDAIWGESRIVPQEGDIAICYGGMDYKRSFFINSKTNEIDLFLNKRFDPIPLPGPIEYTLEVVHCTWCGEPVLFPELHKFVCVHGSCANFVYMCDKCKDESHEYVWTNSRCYCSEHVEQHRPKDEIGSAKVLFDEVELQPTIQESKYDGDNNQENLSARPPVDIDNTANAGIAAVMFGSKPKQMYAEKAWKGPSDEEIQKKANVEIERKRYDKG